VCDWPDGEILLGMFSLEAAGIRAKSGMRILVLGGTRCLDHAVVDAAAVRDWSVTVFSRGASRLAPELRVGDGPGGLDFTQH
jgi:hypothetical protein